MDRYPGEYEETLADWLEENDLSDTPENREAFDNEEQNRAEEAQQRWLECGDYHGGTPKLDPWKAYMEEMR